MNEKILKFLKHDRTYTAGVKLYNEFGNRVSLKRQLNVLPESKMLREILFEELRKIAGITPDTFAIIMRHQVSAFGSPEVPQDPQTEPEEEHPAELDQQPGELENQPAQEPEIQLEDQPEPKATEENQPAQEPEIQLEDQPEPEAPVEEQPEINLPEPTRKTAGKIARQTRREVKKKEKGK